MALQPVSADPSNTEQLLIYELNRARNRPARYARENPVGGVRQEITAVLPQPPLAVNDSLVNSAQFHAGEMATANYIGHQSAVTGDWPNKMARDAGYPLPNFYPAAANNIESIAGGTVINTALAILNLLIIDEGVDPPGHRIHLLATQAFYQGHREVGAGLATNNASVYTNYSAIHTAVREFGGSQFLTGVVYNDANGDRRYGLGEGLAGVTVNNGASSVQTNAAGGWSIAVNPGAYAVSASGGAFFGIGAAKAVVSNRNIEMDFASGSAAGEINFVRANNCALTTFDIDGDCRSDLGIYRDGAWSVIGSSDGVNVVVGLGSLVHTPVRGDYDGDRKTDEAVYYAGVWSILRSSDGTSRVIGHGGPSHLPVAGDYDGDGMTDVAVYLDGVWSIIRSSDGGNTIFGWGGPAFTPVPGDYDGDGITDIAVYNGGVWSIVRSTDGGNTLVGHGGPAFKPVPADFDADGRMDIAVYRDGVWSILRSTEGAAIVGHGGPSFTPVSGDFDGDGRADVSVYQGGVWSILRSTDNGNTIVGHGGAIQDVPLK